MNYNIKDSLGYLLSVSHWKLQQMLAKKFKDNGIEVTPDQWKVLVSLLNSGPLYQSQIAYSILKDRAGVKRLIDQLEKKNLVIRMTSTKDGRQNVIDLTNEGKKVVAKLNTLAKENLNDAFGENDQEEIEKTKRVLKHFIHQFEERNK